MTASPDFDWTKLLDIDRLIDTEAAPAAIPFMITKAQKARLRELGFSEKAISSMTPGEAHRELGLK